MFKVKRSLWFVRGWQTANRAFWKLKTPIGEIIKFGLGQFRWEGWHFVFWSMVSKKNANSPIIQELKIENSQYSILDCLKTQNWEFTRLDSRLLFKDLSEHISFHLPNIWQSVFLSFLVTLQYKNK